MRALLILLVVASGLGALAALSPAQAWYDRWGRWHPNEYRRYPPPPYWAYRPPRYDGPPVYAPPPVYYPPPLSTAPALTSILSRPGHRPNRVRATSPHARIPSKSEVIRRGEQSMPTKTPEKKATTKTGGGGKSNALQKPLQPSKELAAVVGPGALSRAEAVSKVWGYIRAHNLQNPQDRREILADDKLSKVFGQDKVTMFEMNKHLAQHLT